MGSFFVVILAEKIPLDPGVGVYGKVSKLGMGWLPPGDICFLLLVQKYWRYVLKTPFVCYNSNFLS